MLLLGLDCNNAKALLGYAFTYSSIYRSHLDILTNKNAPRCSIYSFSPKAIFHSSSSTPIIYIYSRASSGYCQNIPIVK